MTSCGGTVCYMIDVSAHVFQRGKPVLIETGKGNQTGEFDASRKPHSVQNPLYVIHRDSGILVPLIVIILAILFVFPCLPPRRRGLRPFAPRHRCSR